MKLVFAAFSLMAVCAVQAGIVVDAQSDVPHRVCTDQLTFSWDWSWDWVPSTAQEATLTVRKTGGGLFLSNIVGRAVSSVTWNIGDVGTLLATNADTLVDVTLSFPHGDVRDSRGFVRGACPRVRDELGGVAEVRAADHVRLQRELVYRGDQ